MKMRSVVTSYLATQRVEVFLMTALLPSYLMFESALANGAIYAGGALGFDVRSLIAFGRGLGFEVLTYACAKLFRLLLVKDARRNWPIALVPGIVALFCMVVSAGNNLAWVLSGGEMTGMLVSLGKLMPPAFMIIYQFGLGLVLPVSVGVVAVLDISHLIHEALDHSTLDAKAMEVGELEMHRGLYMKSQNKQKDQIEQAYDGVADARTKTFIDKVKKGDMSFGAKKEADGPGLRRIAPPSPQSQQSMLPGPSQASSAVPSQFSSQLPSQHMSSIPGSSRFSLPGQAGSDTASDIIISMPTQDIGSLPTHGAKSKQQGQLF